MSTNDLSSRLQTLQDRLHEQNSEMLQPDTTRRRPSNCKYLIYFFFSFEIFHQKKEKKNSTEMRLNSSQKNDGKPTIIRSTQLEWEMAFC